MTTGDIKCIAFLNGLLVNFSKIHTLEPIMSVTTWKKGKKIIGNVLTIFLFFFWLLQKSLNSLFHAPRKNLLFYVNPLKITESFLMKKNIEKIKILNFIFRPWYFHYFKIELFFYFLNSSKNAFKIQNNWKKFFSKILNLIF